MDEQHVAVSGSVALDASAFAGIIAAIQDLLDCANAGRVLDGFALYSPNYLQRFMSEHGLTSDMLQEAFGAAQPRGKAHIHLGTVLAAGCLPDGRAWAVVEYREDPPPVGAVSERYTLVWSPHQQRWLIDDIARVDRSSATASLDELHSSGDGSDAAAPAQPDNQAELKRPETRTLPMLANSLALIMGKLATMGLGFLAWLAAARVFSQAEVGLASGVVSATMLCVQVALFGAGAAIISLYPRYRHQPDRLLDTAVTSVMLTAFFATAGFVLLASGIFRELRIVAEHPAYLAVFLIMAVAGTLGVLLDQLSTALRRGDFVLVRGLVTGILTVTLVVVLPKVAGFENAIAILAAWATASVMMVSIGWLQLRRALPAYRYRPRLQWDLAQEQARVGFPNWLLTLAERAPGAVLPIVVTELLSPRANAAWYTAWMMAWVVYVVPVQVGLNLFAEASHRPEAMHKVVRHSIATSLAVGALAATGSAVIGPVLLGFLGRGYAELGTEPLRILVLAVVPFTFVQAYFSVCRARNDLTEAIAVGIVSGGAGIGAAALAGVNHGLIGMALAWLGVQTVTGAWSFYRLQALMRRSERMLIRERASSAPDTSLPNPLPASDPAPSG